MPRIIGIDPGSRITGFGVVDFEGGRLKYVQSGCLRLGDGDFIARLKTIFDEVSDLVRIYKPDQAAIEQVFMHRNPASALKLGQARGAAICALVGAELPVSEYMPAEVKQALVGKGNAAKSQVGHMVQALLELPGPPQEDAADALAIAICHTHSAHTLARLGGARAMRRGRLR